MFDGIYKGKHGDFLWCIGTSHIREAISQTIEPLLSAYQAVVGWDDGSRTAVFNR